MSQYPRYGLIAYAKTCSGFGRFGPSLQHGAPIITRFRPHYNLEPSGHSTGIKMKSLHHKAFSLQIPPRIREHCACSGGLTPVPGVLGSNEPLRRKAFRPQIPLSKIEHCDCSDKRSRLLGIEMRVAPKGLLHLNARYNQSQVQLERIL